MTTQLGEGAHGVVYVCGERTRGHVEPLEALYGRRIKGIYGGFDHFVAVVDAWELDWQDCRDRQRVLEHETATLGLASTRIRHVAFGRHHRLALSLDGEIFSWASRGGVLTDGELGQGDGGMIRRRADPISSVPEHENPLKEALNDGGSLVSLIEQDPPSKGSVNVPRRVLAPKDIFFTKVACGQGHSAAITDKGDLYTWGRNREGQLGQHPAYTLGAWPKYVSAFLGRSPVLEVACGERFTVVLLSDGSVYRFGERATGFTQRPEDKSSARPELILGCGDDGAAVVGVACGFMHVLAVTASGSIYVWGLNSHGQLGLGDDKAGSCGRPQRLLEPSGSWARVFAGGHYSAALTHDGRLATWGSNQHGQLGHDPCIKKLMTPEFIHALQDVRVGHVACSQRELFAFAPSFVAAISPCAGEICGGYELRIRGSGFWASDDLTVRFVPMTEGRLPRGSLGRFDPVAKEIICTVPKFTLPGEFAVEVAMNGKHFTTDGHVFEAYRRPPVVDVSIFDARLTGGEEFEIIVDGDIPRTCSRPLLRLRSVESDDNFVVVLEGRVVGEASVEQERTVLGFVVPTFPSLAVIVRCVMDISYNGGFMFSSVVGAAPLNEDHGVTMMALSPRPFEIAFHDAHLRRCVPNSCLSTDLPQPVELEIHHLLTDGPRDRFSVRLEVTNLCVSEASADARVEVTLPIRDVSVDGSRLQCTIPPLQEWTLTRIDAKTKHRVSVSTDWWKFVPRWGFEARVHVSMNGGRQFLPAAAESAQSIVFLNTLGHVLHASPSHSLMAGGTQVAVAGDYFHCESDDAVALLRWHDREVRVPARCVLPENSMLDSNPDLTLERRVIFKTPPLPFPLPPPPPPQVTDEEDDTATDVSTAPTPATNTEEQTITLGATETVDVFISLDGRSFPMESSVSLTYVAIPGLHDITPSEGEPGTRIIIKADGQVQPVTSACVRLTTATLGISLVVRAEINEAHRTIEFVLPPLPTPVEDTVTVLFSLDGQQYGEQQSPPTLESQVVASPIKTLSFVYRPPPPAVNVDDAIFHPPA